MKEAIEELAREQARLQAEERMREKLGIPENTLANATKALIDAHGHSNDMFAKIKALTHHFRKRLPKALYERNNSAEQSSITGY